MVDNNYNTADTILLLIASANTIYDEIIDNMIAPNFHQKQELISELAISFLTNKKKVNDAIKNNYFQYYFINAVKNQIQSSTSPFHRNVRKTIASDLEIDWIQDSVEDDNQDLEYKILNEKQNRILEEVLDNTDVTWFQAEIFRMYYNENKTFRQIERETGTDHVLCHSVVKKIREKINEQIKKYDI